MDPETLAMLLFQGSGAVPPAPPPVLAPPPATMVAPSPAPVGSPYQEAYRSAPMPPPVEPYRMEPMGIPPAAEPTSLGAALEPSVPLPQPRPAGAPQAAAAPQAGGSDALLKTLRGVQAPSAPTPQKVSTPNAPTPVKMGQNSALIDLLSSLGIGPQQALPGLKLPSTLGQALGGR